MDRFDALFLLGAGSFAAGVFWLSVPAGLMVLGVMAMGISLMGSRSHAGDDS